MRIALLAAAAMAAVVWWPRLGAAQSAVPVRAPSRVTDMREMAMFQNANVYLWLRATDEGTVLVYASTGFRNAFAQPVTLTAEEADRWAALAEPLMTDSLQQAAARRERPDTSSTRDQLAFGDFVLISRPRTNPPTLVVKIGELSPDVVSTTFFAPALRPVVPAIREAARAAREMAASRASDSTARAASLVAVAPPPAAAPPVAAASVATVPVVASPVAASPVAASPVAASPVAASPVAASPVAPAPIQGPATVPARATDMASATPPLAAAQPTADLSDAALVPGSPIAQPLVAPAPTAPAARLATPKVAAAPAVAVAAPAVPAMDVRSLPAMTAPTVAAPATNIVQRPVPSPATVRVATPPMPPAAATAAIAAHDSARASAPRPTPVTVRAPPRTTTVGLVATTTPAIVAAPAAPTTAPAATATTTAPAASVPVDDAGLSDAEFSTEAHRREASITACYAQYGLSINPSLSGHVTVRISLSDSGEVMRATVVDRNWSAAVPTDVESCIVHRVFVWHFPVARRSSSHDYTVSFGH